MSTHEKNVKHRDVGFLITVFYITSIADKYIVRLIESDYQRYLRYRITEDLGTKSFKV